MAAKRTSKGKGRTSASIYHRLGGHASIVAAIDGLYDGILGDAELTGFFANTDVDWLKRQQVAFVGMALGGPERYRGIREKHFAKVAGHLTTALENLGVDDKLVGEVIAVVAPLAADIVTPEAGGAGANTFNGSPLAGGPPRRHVLLRAAAG
jgi:hemoglobin